MDNGPELIASLMEEWSRMHGIEFLYIQLGKPTKNSFVKRFNGTFRRNMLDVHLNDSLDQVRQIAQVWLKDYNQMRPHDSLQGMNPVNYARAAAGGVHSR